MDAEIVSMVLVGKVSKHLVGFINKDGAAVVGLCGTDGRIFTASPLPQRLGFVGEISSVDASVNNFPSTGREFKSKEYNTFPRSSSYIPFLTKPKETLRIPHGLPETAASVAVAATVVGAASIETAQAAPTRTCDDCGGLGLCPECKGEGFVLKRMTDGSAEKARLNAKNMATRYTAGRPKKWSYCTKCLSARSCKSCDGSGKLAY